MSRSLVSGLAPRPRRAAASAGARVLWLLCAALAAVGLLLSLMLPGVPQPLQVRGQGVAPVPAMRQLHELAPRPAGLTFYAQRECGSRQAVFMC
jgi:hypothetical protein